MNFNVLKLMPGITARVQYLVFIGITALLLCAFYIWFTKPLIEQLSAKKSYHRQLAGQYHKMLKNYATSAAYYKANAVSSKPMQVAEMIQDLVVLCESCGLEISSYTTGSTKLGEQSSKQKIHLRVVGQRQNICALVKALEDKRYSIVDKLTIDSSQLHSCAADMSITLGV